MVPVQKTIKTHKSVDSMSEARSRNRMSMMPPRSESTGTIKPAMRQGPTMADDKALDPNAVRASLCVPTSRRNRNSFVMTSTEYKVPDNINAEIQNTQATGQLPPQKGLNINTLVDSHIQNTQSDRPSHSSTSSVIQSQQNNQTIPNYEPHSMAIPQMQINQKPVPQTASGTSNMDLNDLSKITVKVIGSTIRTNEKGKEVLMFLVAIGRVNTGGDLWRVAKLYSDFLALDLK
ncbi:6650_t:CDS:1, partial [Paraglomus occultum]